MAWLPFINNYKPFYIQTVNDSAAWSTEVYGLVAKSNPYPIMPNPKDPYKNDFKDANGDDEYVQEMFYESQEISVKFYCKVPGASEAEKLLRHQVAAFFEKIKKGEFLIYDSYTGIGRQKVRYAGYEEDSFVARDDYARVIFTVKFKVNDPLTQMYYNDVTGQITDDPAEGRTDLLGSEDNAYIITEEGLYIQVA